VTGLTTPWRKAWNCQEIFSWGHCGRPETQFCCPNTCLKECTLSADHIGIAPPGSCNCGKAGQCTEGRVCVKSAKKDTCNEPCDLGTIQRHIWNHDKSLKEFKDKLSCDPVKGCAVTCDVDAGYLKGEAMIKCPKEGGLPEYITKCQLAPCTKDTVKAFIKEWKSSKGLKELKDELSCDPVKGCAVTCDVGDKFLEGEAMIKCPKEGGLPEYITKCQRRPNCTEIVWGGDASKCNLGTTSTTLCRPGHVRCSSNNSKCNKKKKDAKCITR